MRGFASTVRVVKFFQIVPHSNDDLAPPPHSGSAGPFVTPLQLYLYLNTMYLQSAAVEIANTVVSTDGFNGFLAARVQRGTGTLPNTIQVLTHFQLTTLHVLTGISLHRHVRIRDKVVVRVNCGTSEGSE